MPQAIIDDAYVEVEVEVIACIFTVSKAFCAQHKSRQSNPVEYKYFRIIFLRGGGRDCELYNGLDI
jgi:hypothetical protein